MPWRWPAQRRWLMAYTRPVQATWRKAWPGMPAAALSPLRRRGGVLFGTNLVAAIEATIKAAAGNVDRAANPGSLEAIDTLVVRLNVLVQKHPGRAGDREWMFLFRRFIAGALDKGEVPEHTDEELIAMLYATPGSEEATR